MKRNFVVVLFWILIMLPFSARAEEGFVYNDHSQRDPFWPLVSSGGAIVNYDTNLSVSEMLLEGIIADGKSRIAIISGTIVEEGKKIGFYTVQQIFPDHVILVKDGQSMVLRLKKEE